MIMAKSTKGYKQIIKEVENGRYLQKFYECIKSGYVFTEREYLREKHKCHINPKEKGNAVAAKDNV